MSGHTSIEVAVFRSLQFYYVRSIIINSALGSYGAPNCYDCVAHNFDSLTDQYFGVPFPSIIFCLKSIQEMELYLRTGFGESKGS